MNLVILLLLAVEFYKIFKSYGNWDKKQMLIANLCICEMKYIFICQIKQFSERFINTKPKSIELLIQNKEIG